MFVIETIEEMQAACRALRRSGKTLGLVPTMGALHEGHLSLIRASRAACDTTVASIFVNPTQFGPNEDLGKYPRTFESDCAALEREGTDLLFAPSAAEMYPAGASTWVEVEGVGDRLDGASRPGHFRGVATVVAKLFHIVAPTRAFFGQKDAAQLAVLRKMVRDLNFDLEIVGCPIVREPDGLAMSSRNRFLSAEERQRALVIGRALRAGSALVEAGESSAVKLVAAMRTVLASEDGVRVDYVAVVDSATLEEIEDVRAGGLLAIAAVVGTTRLIDNVLIDAVAPSENSAVMVPEEDFFAAGR
jgi:pantoate--beta-alanine ligase